MIKKSLFAVAVLAVLAASVQAGHLKKYEWTCTFDWIAIDMKIPVYMDVGLIINVTNQDKLKIKLKQMNLSDPTKPWTSYEGTLSGTSEKMNVKTNFDLEMRGSFSPSTDPNVTPIFTTGPFGTKSYVWLDGGTTAGTWVGGAAPATPIKILKTVGGASASVDVKVQLTGLAAENVNWKKDMKVGDVIIEVRPTGLECLWKDP